MEVSATEDLRSMNAYNQGCMYLGQGQEGGVPHESSKAYEWLDRAAADYQEQINNDCDSLRLKDALSDRRKARRLWLR